MYPSEPIALPKLRAALRVRDTGNPREILLIR
jgi:hypothetical protein